MGNQEKIIASLCCLAFVASTALSISLIMDIQSREKYAECESVYQDLQKDPNLTQLSEN